MARVIISISLASLVLYQCSADVSLDDSQESIHELNTSHISLALDSHNFRHVTTEELTKKARETSSKSGTTNNEVSSNSAVDKTVSAHTGDERQTHSTETMAQTVQAAIQDMLMVQSNAKKLRSSVERLGLDLGFIGSDKVQEAAADLATRRAETRHRLNGLALESHNLRAVADSLDSQLREQYRRLSGSEALTDQHEQLDHQALNRLQNLGHKFAAAQEFVAYDRQNQGKTNEEPPATGTHEDQAKKVEEDKQFAQLEAETMKIQSWFRQLKQIKQEKDALREKKLEAAKAAKELGLSKEEIADRLQHVGMSKGSSNAHHVESHAEAKTPSALIQVEEGQSLGAVLARSSLEMESTEAAALDVMTGVQAFDAWKQNTNDSRESLVRGLVAKEVMEKRLESLRRSEQAINDRVSQLHHLLGVGSH